MTENNEENSILDSITEIFGFLQIAASPAIVGLVIGYFIFKSYNNRTGFIFAAIIGIFGILAGIIWATSVSKKRGTLNFMTRVSATPELDKVDKEGENQKQE